MLPALALILAQKPAYVTFDAFVAESAKAVLGVAQGTWALDFKDDGPKMSFVVQGNSSKEFYERNGKPEVEIVIDSTYWTYVDHAERTYSQVSFTEWHGGWESERLAPMKDEGIDVRLTPDRGLVLRTNPTVGAARVVAEGKTETLLAGFRKKDGVRWSLELSRDARTKLPIRFSLTVGDGKPQIAGFAFERREVLPFEIAIAPESYKSYRQVPFRSGPSR